jgi:hypothetical protein
MNFQGTKFNNGWLFGAVIFLLVLLCYFNSVKNDFVWDDNTVILQNDKIKDFSNIIGIVFAEDTTADMEHSGFYRPLVYFSYALDYYLWGENPAGFRIINIFFHFVSALVIYYLAILMFNNNIIGFTAA